MTQNRPTAARGARHAAQPDTARPSQSRTPTAYSSESGRTYRLDRLIGKGGSLVKYGSGLEIKRRLLELEGALTISDCRL